MLFPLDAFSLYISRDMSRNAGNDENGKFDDISPKTKIQANDLKTRVPTKWRIRRMRRIWQNYGEFDDILPKNKMQSNELMQDEGINKAVNSTNVASLTNMANLTIFRQD